MEILVAEAERMRLAAGMPGEFRVEDSNVASLPRARYDLIFSAHSFHHFLALERVMQEVANALTPRGLFVLEEFTGPNPVPVDRWLPSDFMLLIGRPRR